MNDDQQREAMAVELAGLRRDAERARWCEEKKADVYHTGIEWIVMIEGGATTWAPTRNAAIDAAMKEGK